MIYCIIHKVEGPCPHCKADDEEQRTIECLADKHTAHLKEALLEFAWELLDHVEKKLKEKDTNEQQH